MSIFLDSSRIEDVRKFHAMGIIRGVTTNPSILLKNGFRGKLENIRTHLTSISDIIQPLPLSIGVTTNEQEEMSEQAKEISSWGKNVNVKIPIHGPKGEVENLEVVHRLETKENVRVNVTAMMNAQQCLLAALAGATYVSLLGGRINNMGYDTIEEIKKIRKLLDDFNLKTKIIIGSVREILNVGDWLNAGAHIVTVEPKFIEGLIIHPYSKETVQMFLDDAKKMELESC